MSASSRPAIAAAPVPPPSSTTFRCPSAVFSLFVVVMALTVPPFPRFTQRYDSVGTERAQSNTPAYTTGVMQQPPLEFSHHAVTRMNLRKIPREWVERVIAQPVSRVQDPEDPVVELFLCPIPEFGDRVLLVAVNTRLVPWRVVTVFFDHRMRGQL
ncbi:MAG: DUF4258 domain-containing protein [Dehalococcoidia bacterium]|nr:DUF4258 domain-containing protein [Dehalococcoidia bacterium]